MPRRPKSKARGRCWTCRLRRKGCDGAWPSCRSCATLQITCYSGDTKPDWMDGAAKQRAMAEMIKARIKDGANGRRQRRAENPASTQNAFIVFSQQDFMDDSEEHDKLSQPSQLEGSHNLSENRHFLTLPSVPHTDKEVGDIKRVSPGATLSSSSPSMSTKNSNVDIHDPIPKSVLDLAHEPQRDTTSSPATLTSPGRAWEMDFTMIYLDYVFPFLFPFYRPPLVGTSRAWLLSFMRQNSAVFHSVLSLSSFFFTVALKDIFGEREPCKSLVWKQVVNQAGMSFEQIQKDLAEINNTTVHVDPLQKAHLMENIVQLLIFELFVSRSVDWNTHLLPALTLFEDIFEEATRAHPAGTGLLCVLEPMAWSRPCVRGLERPVWNPDQAAFRFFLANLVYMDIVASTSLERAPLLRKYHSRILADSAPEQITDPLDLSAFLGCQNWVLLAVGQISSLDAWKKRSIEAGNLSQLGLEEQANGIFQDLDKGLYRLDTPSALAPGTYNSNRSYHLQPYYNHKLQYTGRSPSELPTRIWAHAARAYLSVVVSRSATSDARTRRDVAQVVKILQSVDCVAQMHTFAWPMCVAGCLAEGKIQQQEFETIITGAGHPQLLSALHEAGRIMKTVWASNEGLGRGTLDIAACLQILGLPALLV